MPTENFVPINMNFDWPDQEVMATHAVGGTTASNHNQHSVTESAIDAVVDTVKNVVTEFINRTETMMTTTISPQETVNSNRTTTGLNDTSTNEEFGSNSTAMNFNNIPEVTDSDNTAVTTAMSEISNVTTSIGDSMTTVIDTIVTTSKKVADGVTELVTSTMATNTSEENKHLHYDEGNNNDNEETTLYIVLGVILAALLVIIVILLIIYKKYKKISGPRTGTYCVADLNQVSVSSCRNSNDEI